MCHVGHGDRAGLHHDPDDQGVTGHGFQPPDLGGVDDARAPLGFFGEVLCCFEQRRFDRRDVCIHWNADVDDRPRPALRHVADPGDLAVADVPERAVHVAHVGDPHGDVFDDSRREPHVDHVADADLILGDDEQSVEHVLDDVLRAEAEARPDRGGQQRERAHQVGREPVGDQDERDDHDRDVDDVLQNRAEGAGALDETHIRERRALKGLCVVDIGLELGAIDDPEHDAPDQQSQHERDDDAEDDDQGDVEQVLPRGGEPGQSADPQVGQPLRSLRRLGHDLVREVQHLLILAIGPLAGLRAAAPRAPIEAGSLSRRAQAPRHPWPVRPVRARRRRGLRRRGGAALGRPRRSRRATSVSRHAVRRSPVRWDRAPR